jgi:hypothetical protein
LKLLNSIGKRFGGRDKFSVKNVKLSLVFWMAVFILGIFLCFSTQVSATVDTSWAWCPDRITNHTLTYCVDESVNVNRANWIDNISDAAKEWSDQTSWTIKAKNSSNLKDCTGANIKFTQVSGLAGSTGETRPHFKDYVCADKDSKCIHCLDWVDIEFNKDISWSVDPKSPLNDPKNCAKHEIGHALMLDHGPPNNTGVKKDIMYYKNQHLHALSAHDKQEANDAAKIDIYMIHQLHKPIGPGGSYLAYAGFDIEIPPGALTETESFGIHPTSSYSTPYPTTLASVVDRLIRAAEIGVDNDTNSVELNVPATITMHYNDSELSSRGLEDFQAGVGATISPLAESTLKACFFNSTTSSWEVIPDSVVNTFANTVTFQINELGTFGTSTAFFAIGGKPQEFPITIEAETNSTVELDTLKLTVTGVADDPITVEALPLSKNVIFEEGVDDTPTGANFHGNWFTGTIDADGIRKYAVEFNDTGTYTIKVTVTGGDREGDSDTVDITVLKKEVTFDLPDEVVIGDKITIKGTSTSGTYVSVYVDFVLYPQLANMVIEDGEFSKEVTTTEVGMYLPGSVRLRAWIDCEKAADEERPTRSPDGEDAILLTKPTLTAELSVPVVVLEDDFTVFGTAKGQTEVTILCVPPKGGGGKSLLDKGEKGLSPRKASVSMMDYTFSKKMTVQEDATQGYYDIYVMSAGMDGEWGTTGEANLEAALNVRKGIPSLTEGVITTKTKADINDILVYDFVMIPRSDDLMAELRLKVETAYVKLDPVADVIAGEPLVVTGKSNRQEGYVIVVTCKGPVELAPKTVKVENDTFGATFDTTGALTGEYTVKADDGNGHVDEGEVFITGTGLKAIEEVEEVVEEILATPTPKPTPQPPGF